MGFLVTTFFTIFAILAFLTAGFGAFLIALVFFSTFRVTGLDTRSVFAFSTLAGPLTTLAAGFGTAYLRSFLTSFGATFFVSFTGEVGLAALGSSYFCLSSTLARTAACLASALTSRFLVATGSGLMGATLLPTTTKSTFLTAS